MVCVCVQIVTYKTETEPNEQLNNAAHTTTSTKKREKNHI